MSLPAVELVEVHADGNVSVTIGHGPAQRSTVLVTDQHFTDHGAAKVTPVIDLYYSNVKDRANVTTVR